MDFYGRKIAKTTFDLLLTTKEIECDENLSIWLKIADITSST